MGTRCPSPQTAGSFAAAPDWFSKRASQRNGHASLPRMRAGAAVQPFSAPGVLQPDLRRKPAEGRSPPLTPTSSAPDRAYWTRAGIPGRASACRTVDRSLVWLCWWGARTPLDVPRQPRTEPAGKPLSTPPPASPPGLADALEGLPRGSLGENAAVPEPATSIRPHRALHAYTRTRRGPT